MYYYGINDARPEDTKQYLQIILLCCSNLTASPLQGFLIVQQEAFVFKPEYKRQSLFLQPNIPTFNFVSNYYSLWFKRNKPALFAFSSDLVYRTDNGSFCLPAIARQ